MWRQFDIGKCYVNEKFILNFYKTLQILDV